MNRVTIADMIKFYGLPLDVSPKQFCQVAGIGLTRFYALAKQGKIRIRKNGRSSTVSIEDLYEFLRGDQAAA
ncbi:hypothetical protein QA633_43595 [Bradyrhizobium barranii]|uniref:hypothetical protein n=1 Tax=Bradyrhizobium barranii TaxID=2992140 RepID=UPI0024AFD785|nr:hypothetical protein [Bradyrhizobium barranii]WFT95058.1 hypothetical protein QA633_43595 [Bradyrhizobium barranii]